MLPYRSTQMAELATPADARSGAPKITAVEFSLARHAMTSTSGPSRSRASSSGLLVVYPLRKSSGKTIKSASECSSTTFLMASRFCDVSRNVGLSCASAALTAPDIPYHLPLRSSVDGQSVHDNADGRRRGDVRRVQGMSHFDDVHSDEASRSDAPHEHHHLPACYPTRTSHSCARGVGADDGSVGVFEALDVGQAHEGAHAAKAWGLKEVRGFAADH